MSVMNITLSQDLLESFDAMVQRRGATRSAFVRMLITRELIENDKGVSIEFDGVKLQLADTISQNFSHEGRTRFFSSQCLLSALTALGVDFGLITDRSKQMYLSAAMGDLGFLKSRHSDGRRGFLVKPTTLKSMDFCFDEQLQ